VEVRQQSLRQACGVRRSIECRANMPPPRSERRGETLRSSCSRCECGSVADKTVPYLDAGATKKEGRQCRRAAAHMVRARTMREFSTHVMQYPVSRLMVGLHALATLLANRTTIKE